MATLGLIGSGHIGGTLARLAVDAGLDVVLSNSRSPQTLSDLVDELGPQARVDGVNEFGVGNAPPRISHTQTASTRRVSGAMVAAGLRRSGRAGEPLTPASVTIEARNAKSSNLSGLPSAVAVIVPLFRVGCRILDDVLSDVDEERGFDEADGDHECVASRAARNGPRDG
jgi:NADP oxidoreductase coenzyme F420-dependent